MTKKNELQLMVQTLAPRLQLVAPRGADWERNVNILLGVVQKNPKLSKCSRSSFAIACMAVTTAGLDPSPEKQLVYLIPRGGEMEVMIGYKGLMDIALKCGAKDIRAEVVKQSEEENGDFQFTREPHPSLTHNGRINRSGPVVGAYCVVTMEDGRYLQAVISREDIERARACAYGGGKSGPWKDHFEQMAKKTAIRALLRSGRVPLTSKLAEVLSLDEEQEQAAEVVPDEPLVIDQTQRALDALV
tara:strand:+ start:1178 stop:1912 length:735 start_codon:yes stop_codon:yes gene_type:complete